VYAALLAGMVGSVATLALGGCSGVPIRSDDTIHYLIIGIGVVSVPAGRPDVRVDRVRALGLTFADHPGLRLSLGYTSGLAVAVPEHAGDVYVEVSQRPFGPLRVHTAPVADTDSEHIDENGLEK
jgi:hypothetical protein